MPGNETSGDEVDSEAVARAQDLLEQFLAGRSGKTVEAYTLDLEEFARFCDRPPAVAVAELLAGGPSFGRNLVMEYARALRAWGRAPSTIRRRLATLRVLVRSAYSLGGVGWLLEVPTGEELAGLDAAPMTDSRHYLLPRHPSEIDRLDLQHYAIRMALGANHQSPVEAPALVLDVGAGTGQWGWDISEEFPGSLVVGLDLVPGKPERPPRYQPLRANLLEGLPFQDAAFDVVHQRLLFQSIPALSWPAVVGELLRVTRPGGWVELVEPRITLRGAGPAIDRLWELALAAASARGLDTSGTVYESLDGYLRQAGARQVERREVELPIGEWGGQVGSLMATDFRAGSTRLLEARTRLDAQERRDLLQRVQEEFEERHVTTTLAVAFGQR
jgi:SAM-dependent methyltransferase